MNSNFRYKINNRLGQMDVFPLGEDDFKIEFNAPEKGKATYQKDFPSKIVFTGDAYKRLLKIEQSIYRCEYTDIVIERRCVSGATINWVPSFASRISLNNGVWDLDLCKVEISIDEDKPEQCFEDNKDVEVNILQIAAPNTIKLYQGDVTIETVTYERHSTEPGICTGEYWGGAGTPEAGGWIVYYDYVNVNLAGETGPGSPYGCHVITKWARQVLVLSCTADAPGLYWIFLSETTGPPCTRKYVRNANLYMCTRTYGHETSTDGYEYSCEIANFADNIKELDNAIMFKDIIEYFVHTFCPELTVKSDFFQINPDNLSDINYITLARSKTRFIAILQKSDVKRPTATQNASLGKITFEKLMLAITEMFNVQWKIDGSYFRIEAPSYWPQSTGINLMQDKYKNYVVKKRKYSYDNEQIPSSEEYRFMEAGYGDFAGAPIVYTGGCVTKVAKSSVKVHAVDFVTTDVELCLSNPESDSKVVSDDGFVFVACDFDGTNYYIITEANILAGTSQLNNSLGWAHLHRDYHKYNRPLRRGFMNYVDTEFITIIPTKKGEKITIPFCCGDVFNPDDLVTGPFGDGTVKKSSFSFKNSTLELELLYPSDLGLVTNAAPVVDSFSVHTYKNIFIDIPIYPHVTDADTGAAVNEIIIYLAPINGTAVLLPGGIIRFTPALDYVGDVFMSYRVKDDWNEPSNVGNINIMVFNTNQPPVATDKEYNIYMDNELSMAAPGLFLGDTDELSFSLYAFDAVSAQGGAVVVNGDGSFTYNPPAGYFGDDTFTYSIIDEEGLIGTGNVLVHVLNPDLPFTVEDNYNTPKNQTLIQAAPGLLANDFTTTAPLSTVAETKSTEQGGSVTIGSDGSFTYTPPTGFTGDDGFDYTAVNPNGNSAGHAIVHVLPTIYARMQKINDNYIDDGSKVCGAQTIPNFHRIATFRVYFYSDAGGTTPLDITGYGLILNVLSDYTISVSPTGGTSHIINHDTYLATGGVYYDFKTNYQYTIRHTECPNTEDRTDYLSLEAGAYIIIT